MKKKTYLNIILGLTLLCLLLPQAKAWAESIIIDHTAVDEFDKIPDYYVNEVKKMWLNIPGESHSKGYRIGLSLLAQKDPKYAVVVTESGSPEPYRTDALRISGLNRNQYNGWDTSAGEDKWYADPSKSSRIKDHINYCNTHNLEISAIGFGWCWDMTWHNSPGGGIDPVYQVRWAGSSVGGPQGDLRWGLDADDYALTGNTVNMDTYLNATEEYDQHCRINNYKTKVIFTTGPVDGGGNSGESGYQRHLKHQYIRNYVKAEENRILFDYADILTHNDSGDERIISWTRGSEFGAMAGTTEFFPYIHPDNMKDLSGGYVEDGDHIGEIGALRLGKTLWVLMARIAGWEGVSGFLYGDVSGNKEISAYDAALTAQYSVGLITLTPEQFSAADVDGSKDISAYDAALIAQYAVGLIIKFPVEP